MGKKAKVGKARRDKYYHLAKETGYRSRAAFKLIELNRQYHFLNNARVVIDLCAAPGGWMQVAVENTPVSCFIIGVDLFNIRPIYKCVSIQADITTEKCKQELKSHLHDWKVDCVLNDGAPNIGRNWQHDAYNQSDLTLYALKLATSFLKKGASFITKLFRSKDYFPLLWVFKQLFGKVNAVKPHSSRSESAEIFVVCEKYVAPDHLDPKLLDPKYVFKDVSGEPVNAINLVHPEKKQRHREGYAEGDYTLFHVLNASQFISSVDFLEKLATSSMIEIDQDFIANSKHTTVEVKECCKDIKVLGRKEIRLLLSWRKSLANDLEQAEKPCDQTDQRSCDTCEDIGEEGVSNHSEEERELEEILTKVSEEERKVTKRKKRKDRKLVSRNQHLHDLKIKTDTDYPDCNDEVSIFRLATLKSKQALDAMDSEMPDQSDGDVDYDIDDDDVDHVLEKRRMLEVYDKGSKCYDLASEYPSDEEGLEEPGLDELDMDGDECSDEVNEDSNPLLVDLETRNSRLKSRTIAWFNKVFSTLDAKSSVDGEDGVAEEDPANDCHPVKSTVEIPGEGLPTEKDCAESGVDVGSDSVDSDDMDDTSAVSSRPIAEERLKRNAKSCEKLEVVPVDGKPLKLDPVGLAMGTALVQSRKRKRDMIDNAYFRHMRGDGEDLPDWFVRDEKRNYFHQMPVTKEEVQEYVAKQRALDARPIKKLAEAKFRKKKRMCKKLEKVGKKAGLIGDTVEVCEREKMQKIKQLYKKAGLIGSKKPEKTYVVCKKGTGKRAHRPHGLKGPYKVVDARMKKDNRSAKESAKRGKGKKPLSKKASTKSRRSQDKKKGPRR